MIEQSTKPSLSSPKRAPKKRQRSTKKKPSSTPRRTGRPTKLNPLLVERLCLALEEPLPIGMACDLVGLHRSTFHRWMRRGEGEDAYKTHPAFSDFCDRVTRARARGQVKLFRTIRDDPKGGWRAATWLLERLNPEDFGPVSCRRCRPRPCGQCRTPSRGPAGHTCPSAVSAVSACPRRRAGRRSAGTPRGHR